MCFTSASIWIGHSLIRVGDTVFDCKGVNPAASYFSFLYVNPSCFFKGGMLFFRYKMKFFQRFPIIPGQASL